MCLSQIGKLLYLSLMFVIFCCTVVGTFTPHWRDLYKAGGSGDSIGHIGLKGGCDMSSDTEEPYNSYCTCWDNNKPKYENTVKGFLYAAMAIQILAMGWVMLSCLAFCYHSRFMHALSAWSALILMCLAVAVIAFLANKEKTIQLGQKNNTFEMTVKIGYSFDLIAAATACSIISIVIGAMTSWLSDQPFC